MISVTGEVIDGEIDRTGVLAGVGRSLGDLDFACKCIARLGELALFQKAVQDHAVNADFGGHSIISKEGVLSAGLANNLRFIFYGERQDGILGNATVLTLFTQAFALVAFLVRDAAGTGSLLGFAGRVNEAFPIPLLFRGDFDPLAEGAVVDLRGGLFVIIFHSLVPFRFVC